VDAAYDEFWNIYSLIYNQTFQAKRQRFNKNIHKLQNFMTNGLLISRKTKNLLYKASISDPSMVNRVKYTTYKAVYQRVLRAAKKLYFTSKLEQNVKNPKKTWETLNEILGKCKKTEKVEKINIDGNPVSDPPAIANQFNKFFTAVGRQISDSVLPVQKNPEDYINYGRPVPDLSLQNTTPEHIQKIIKKLQPKISNDAQGVSTKMVKMIGIEISYPLAHIFNLSLRTGVFPNKLKLCRVIPIFKAGNILECDNYRPISLLSSISKILEKIVSQKLIDHLLTNDLLYVHQYGFLPGRSTEQNLIQIINYISQALDEGNFCIGVFLDLKKAFDVCSHQILLKKLNKMGIRGQAYNWFKSYLEGRSQFVDINGCKSDPLGIDISVIQGSTLGPILFLCYINDFFTASTLFSVLFADDATSLGKGKNLAELTTYINGELQKIANWFRSNKMAVNTAKTKFIVFRTRGKRVDPTHCELLFNNNEIGHVPEDPNLIFPITRIHNEGEEKSFKLLGLLFDEYLSFDSHVDNLCSKIAKSLFCMNRIKNFVTTSALKMLYYAMVHSHIAYCLNVYSCANSTTMNKLKIMQKKAIRIVCNANYLDHTGPLFKQQKILPLEELIKLSALKFMHKYTHGKLPLSFNEMWITNRQRNPNIELRNADNYYVPPHHYATTKRFPFFSFPRIWNEADQIKNNPSISVFLKNVKSAMFASIIV
jgi:signal recognition particle subunit SEC65